MNFLAVLLDGRQAFAVAWRDGASLNLHRAVTFASSQEVIFNVPGCGLQKKRFRQGMVVEPQAIKRACHCVACGL